MSLTDRPNPTKPGERSSISRGTLERVVGSSPPERGETALDLAGLDYRVLGEDEARVLAADVEQTIATKPLRQSGDPAADVWQQGWGEVAARLRGEPVTPDSLRPGYFRDERHFRLDSRYVEALAPLVEYRTSIAVRQLIFARFLADAPRVVELGCGTGINVLLLARAYPAMQVIGCDWAPASQDILALMEREHPGRIAGARFDMLTAEGWDGSAIDGASVVLTVHALEQLYVNWRTCLDFILARRPRLCLHVEPLIELYDPANEDDARMLRYHRKRRYLEGFLPEMQRMAAAGEAEIVDLRRVAFSGLYHEAYSILAWRPL